MLVEITLTIVFAVHLLAVNVASAGPLACLWLYWRERRGDSLAGHVGRALARQSGMALAIGMVLGLAAMAILWRDPDGHYARAMDQLPVSRVWFGVAELAFYFACVEAFCWFWRPLDDSAKKRRPRWFSTVGWWMLPLLASTNLAYHFPTLFGVVAVASTREGEWAQSTGFRLAMLDPEVLSRTLHHTLASFAVTGLAISANAWRLTRFADSEGGGKAWSRRGARLALIPTLAQFAAGAYVLGAMPTVSLDALLGENVLATVLFACSLIATLWLLHLLSAMSLGNPRPKDVGLAWVSMAVVVTLMVATRNELRKNEWKSKGPASQAGVADRALES